MQRYYALFPAERIKVFLYEDLIQNPAKLFQDLFQFLEVDECFEPDTSQRVRKAPPVPKNKALHSLVSRPNGLKSLLKPFLPQKLRTNLVSKINQNNLAKPKINPETYQNLIQEYQADILQLQDLIDRDLSHWLRGLSKS